MIVEWILSIGAGIAEWALTLFPKFEPNQVANAAGQVANIGTVVGGMSPWVNWFALGGQVFIVVGLYLTFLTFRILRALLGHIPGIGGNG